MYIVYIQQLMNIFRLFDLNNIFYLCLWLLKAFPAGTGFGDKNYPKACLRGVFCHKNRKAQSAIAFKRVYLVLFTILLHQY